MPRPVHKGATYLITRRTVLRHKLLRPDPLVKNLILYTLCVAAERFGVQVHALCAMSTHIHLVITDQDRRLPDFLAFFHRIVALGTQALFGWEGSVWDSEQTSAVLLPTRQSMVEKIAYTLANPVTARLVERASEWPGATVRIGELACGVLRATLPKVFFSRKNRAWPREAALELSLPPAIAPEDAASFCADVAAALANEEANARRELAAQGAKVLGAKRAARVFHHERATSHEARYARNPTFAVGSGAGEAMQRAVDAVRAFRKAYRKALEEWKQPMRDVLFPAGTWWMRVFHCVGEQPDVTVS